VSALSIHVADESLRDATQDPESPTVRALEAGGTGATYGNLSFQFPLAVGWWAIGHAVDSGRAADAGRDLVRAQISALSWTYVFKYAADRTRPNGDPRSFPSGHATAAFATAMVLQDHYGWKLGVPVFAAAALTAASRITVNKHWASDVTFGAALGMASARTVTIHLRRRELALGPLAVPGGGGVAVRVQAASR
jgi:membrane-associated phospholipid phosphatase